MYVGAYNTPYIVSLFIEEKTKTFEKINFQKWYLDCKP